MNTNMGCYLKRNIQRIRVLEITTLRLPVNAKITEQKLKIKMENERFIPEDTYQQIDLEVDHEEITTEITEENIPELIMIFDVERTTKCSAQ